MFEKITPEAAGISSRKIAKLLARIADHGVPMHGLVMMRGDKIFGEYYWAPFDKDTPHRMYSATKSYTAIAIGLLIDDGKLSLDDKIVDLFPEKIHSELSPFVDRLTVREMLMMSTTGNGPSWFALPDPDRTEIYFNNKKFDPHPSGTVWQYDSAGSQVLGALVDKLAGKPLFDFLNERIFSHLGTFRDASLLKTRNGDSWGDSALIATTRDAASMALLLMRGGKWEGKQLISESYVKEATSPLVANAREAQKRILSNGYGYQIWTSKRGGFAFNGMGTQITIGLPKDDIIFSINADTQGFFDAIFEELLLSWLFELLEDYTGEALPEDNIGEDMLAAESSDLQLFALSGIDNPTLKDKINGVTYICNENAMGITEFTLSFGEDEGTLRYTNEQGEKLLPFGINKNLFGRFPELGYSQDFGGLKTTDGSTYADAVSAAFLDANKLQLHVQIIDRYLGHVTMVFAFRGDYAVLQSSKCGEDFLDKYEGITTAKRK